jgi:hypothetical protein
MAATLEQLEKRLSALELEVWNLRTRLENQLEGESLAERLIREAKASQPAISAGLDELREQLGIPRDFKPMSLEEMREQMIAEGVKPEDRELSREIIRMREE